MRRFPRLAGNPAVRRILLPGCVVLALVASEVSLTAQEVPLRNWSAPEHWRPSATAGSKELMGIVLPFRPISPCRIADTRGLAGFSGQAGSPILAGNTKRNFVIAGTVPGLTTQCGIPSTASAVSFNFTVVGMNTAGNLIAWPANLTQPNTSVINWNASSVALGNGAVIQLNANSISVYPNVPVGGQTNLVIDVNGYYSPIQTSVPGDFFPFWANEPNGGAIESVNFGSGTNAYGLRSYYAGTNVPLTGGIFGGLLNPGAVGNQAGVLGSVGDLPAVPTGCCAPVGVRGEAAFNAIVGVANDRAVVGQGISATDGSMRVEGQLGRLTNDAHGWGVYGFNSSQAQTTGSGGVRGDDLSSPLPAGIVDLYNAGVMGHSANYFGVFGSTGLSGYAGVGGEKRNTSGTFSAGGYLGWTTTVGVYFINGLAGTGTKSFVEPHPTDASKMIQYVSIEGPEAGVYFRGRGRFAHGVAVIEVPDYFSMVATEEGMSVHVTPIGELAQVAVTRLGLDQIGLKASRDVEFFYTVNSVRKAYPTWDPIRPADSTFLPAGPDAKLPEFLSENERQRLISNGAFNADGSANLDTARRLGLDKQWRAKAGKVSLAPSEDAR